MEYENVEQAVPVTPKKPQLNPVIRYAIIGAIAIVALAIVISVIVALVPGKFTIRNANSIDYATNDDNEYVFVFNGKKMVEIPDDISEEIESVSYDYNHKYAVFTTAGEEKSDGEYKYGDLYVVNSSKYQKVAEEVSSFQLSAFGNTFAYIADNDLYFGELSKPTKAKKIDSKVDYISAMSPNGKNLAYCMVEVNSDADEIEIDIDTYISKNGKKAEKFSKKNAEIFAISNDAKYVYYLKDSKLYVNDTKIADSEYWTSDYSFNRDASQIIYSVSTKTAGEYKTYLISKAGEKVSIGKGSYEDVLSPNGAYSKRCYNTSTFAKCAVNVSVGEDSVYYYLKNIKSAGTKISALKNAEMVMLLDDAKTVLFIKNKDLRSANITKPDADPKNYSGFEDDVTGFSASANGDHIYVVDADMTLYYVKSLKKATKIEEDINGFFSLNDGSVYFLNDDEELCYAKKSSNSKVVTDEFDGISDVDYVAEVVSILSEEQYGILNGKKFKKLFDAK